MVRQLFGMAIGQIEEELQIGRHGPIMTARDGDRRRLAGRNSTTALANGKVWWLMKTTIYGIRNCDMMKKARAWLDARRVAYAFHDYKAAGIGRDKLEGWAARVGWEALLNRTGTTFRKLPERDREGLTEARALALMLAQPSMIRRPVLEAGAALLVGFKPVDYERVLSKT
jgi:arsenate reductase (glutaredoxin)